MTNFENLFLGTAQAQPAQTQTSTTASSPQSGGPLGSLGMFAPMLAVFAIFYFLMIRPQQRQKKQHQALLQNLKKGDEVVTTAGIHGKVWGIADNLVTLEIADNIRIKMDKQQVATVKTAAVTA